MLGAFDDPTLSMSLAAADDAEGIATVLRSAYASHAAAGLNFSNSTATPAMVRVRVKRHEVYVIRRSGQIVGTVTLRTKEDAGGVAAYVNALAVDPSLQGSGIGTMVMDRVEREALARGLGRVRLDTAKPAVELVRWYERRGYRAVGEEHWEGKTYDSVVMEKQLTQHARQDAVTDPARGSHPAKRQREGI